MNDLSFCKFHFPDNIKKVIWEITNQCNYSCEYCIFSSTGKKPRGELSFQQIKETLQQLHSGGFNYIKFTGGEPFIREDFIDILMYATSLNFSFDISTNASFITEKISKQLSLLASNFIHVSLDGYDLISHESVRGKKSFDKTMTGLQHLLKYNKNIRLGCVIHSLNEYHLDKVVDLANNLMVKEIIFSMMSPIGRMDKNSLSISSKTPQELITTIESIPSFYTQVRHNLQSDIKTISFKSRMNTKECPGGDQFLFIDSIGIVSPCTWVSENFPEFHLLSLHDNSLIEILEHNLFKDFNYQKSLLKGECFAFSYEPKQEFNKIYSFATENIGFIDKLSFKNNETALVVTGSGDQAITLINYGFTKITCIDINYLANYYTQLKIAALTVLPFYSFISFFQNQSQSFNYQLYKKFSYLLTPEAEKFWNRQYINYHYNGVNLRNGELFNLHYDTWEQKVFNVPYLQSEALYSIIQKKITNCTITFITSNITEHTFKENYDLILLSNISDYSHKMFPGDYIKSFKTSFVEYLLPFVNDNGLFMFSYLYDFENQGTSSIRNKMNVPLIRQMYFKEFQYQEFHVSSSIQNFEHDVVCYIQK